MLVSRLIQFPLILAIIYVLTFLLAWMAPGSPFEGDRKMPPAARKALEEKFHAQSTMAFLTYYPLRIVTHGDFGPSMTKQAWNVSEQIWQRLPVSMALGAAALAIATAVGTFAGTLAAVYKGRSLDWVSLTFTLVGISLPGFVVAGVLAAVFITWLNWFSIGFGDSPMQVVLPAVALSLAPMAYITRLTRVSMLDVLGADYVRTARAKGCSKPVVVFKHCLRNAFLPVFSYLGPAAAAAMTGSFVVERIFGIHGMGEVFLEAITNRDQTLILGTVIVYSFLLLAFNLIVDMGYSLVDPRIDVSGGGISK
jgi:oligopeptide transport system permease protein